MENDTKNKKEAIFPWDSSKNLYQKDYASYPQKRKAYSNVYDVIGMNTKTYYRNPDIKKSDFEYDLKNKEILDFTITTDLNEKITVQEYFDRSDTDGMMIIKDGKVIFEDYYFHLEQQKIHAWFSMSKSIVGIVGMILEEKGLLDFDKKIKDYLPFFEDMWFGEYKVKDAFNHQLPLNYTEKFSADRNDDLMVFSRIVSLLPPDGDEPTLIEYFKKFDKHPDMKDGEFAYMSPVTDMCSLIISNATGKETTEWFDELIYQKIGAEFNMAWTITNEGFPATSGGAQTSLRDAARIGQLILNKGVNHKGEQIIPDIFSDIFEKAAEQRPAYKNSVQNEVPDRYNGAYYNQLWFYDFDGNKRLAFNGLFGQTLVVDFTTNSVAISFKSHTGANSAEHLRYCGSVLAQIIDNF